MDLITYGLKHQILTPAQARKARELRNQDLQIYFDYLKQFNYLSLFHQENLDSKHITELTPPNSMASTDEHILLPFCWKLLEKGVLSATELNDEIIHLEEDEQTPDKLLQSLFKKNKIVLKQFVELYPFTLSKESTPIKGYSVILQKEGLPSFSQSQPAIAKFGPFRIIEQVGQGGMGTVFRALDALERTVALKKLNTDREHSELGRQRFFNEAKIMAAVDHPLVIKVFDYGSIDKIEYISMEYISGHTLDCYFKSNNLGLREKIKLLHQITQGLQALHQNNIWHRDLKPLNIMVTPQETIKIMDFGLAKKQEQNLTRTGVLIGTPNYMAPEQIDSKRLGEPSFQSDIFSLGVIFYEILTGNLPFIGASLPQLLKGILSKKPVPPRLITPEVPQDLEVICLRCLEKLPKDRYSSIDQVENDLDLWLRGYPIKTRPYNLYERLLKWGLRNRLLLGSIACLILILVGIVVWQWHRQQTYLQSLFYKAEQFTSQKQYEEAINIYVKTLPLTNLKTLNALQKILQQIQNEDQSDPQNNLGQKIFRFNLLRQIFSLAPYYPPFIEARFYLGESVIRSAIAGGDFRFAHYVFQEIQNLSDYSSKTESLKKEIIVAQNARKQKQLDRLDFWVNKIRESQLRDREIISAKNEVEKFDEPEVYKKLLDHFQNLSRQYLALKSSVPPSYEILFPFLLELLAKIPPELSEFQNIVIAMREILKNALAEENIIVNYSVLQIDFCSSLLETLGNLAEKDLYQELFFLKKRFLRFKNKQNGNVQHLQLKLTEVLKKISSAENVAIFQEYEDLMLSAELASYPKNLSFYEKATRLYPEKFEAQIECIKILFCLGNRDSAWERLQILAQKFPQNDEIQLWQAVFLKNRGKYQEATQILEKFSEEALSNNINLFLFRVLFLMDLKEYEKILVLLNHYLTLFPRNVPILTLRAKVYIQQNKWNEALDDLKLALLVTPEDPQIYELLSSIYWRLKQSSEGLPLLKEALALFPEDYKFHYYRGLWTKYLGDIEGGRISLQTALNLLEKQLQETQNTSSAISEQKAAYEFLTTHYMDKAEAKATIIQYQVTIYNELRKHELALSSARAILKESVNIQSLAIYGNTVLQYVDHRQNEDLKKGLLQEAISQFESFPIQNENLPEFWNLLARLYLKVGDLEKIEKILKRLEAMENQNYQRYLIAGDFYFQKQQYKNSLKNFNLWLIKNPNDLMILSQKASIYYCSKDFEKAIETFEQVLEKEKQLHQLEEDPIRKRFCYLLLAELYLQKKESKKALGILWEGIQSLPQELELYSEFLKTATQQQNNPEILKVLNYGIEKNPEEPYFYYQRGDHYFRIKAYEQCASDFEKAITLSVPEHSLSLEQLKIAQECVKRFGKKAVPLEKEKK